MSTLTDTTLERRRMATLEHKVEQLQALARECAAGGHPSTAGLIRLTITGLTNVKPLETIEESAAFLRRCADSDIGHAAKGGPSALIFANQAADKLRAAEILEAV